MNTDIKTIRKITSFCLALVIASMTLCTASCGKSAEDLTPPEMEYPKLSEKCYNADGELIDEDIYEYDADGCLVSHKYIIKVQKMDWELQGNRFHGDFLL